MRRLGRARSDEVPNSGIASTGTVPILPVADHQTLSRRDTGSTHKGLETGWVGLQSIDLRFGGTSDQVRSQIQRP
jgi:hypothetical protein